MSDIKKLLDERLWNFIKRSHNSENYTAAILDSIHFIGDLIREKSGLDSDGLNLIGNAFGGKNPKIKINSLQTETDINIQNGIEQSLRGIYSAFRNPRSHTKYEDNEEDANAIILFINHLLKLIDKSKGAFSIESFLGRISDKSFVDNDLYVDLLIETIPKNKYFDATFELFKFKDHLPVKNLQPVFHNLLRELTVEQYEQIIDAASGELRYTDDDDCITKTIALIGHSWDHISEDAKLRAENVLIKYLDNAKYADNLNINHHGSYCLSLRDIYNNLSLK
ncbi:MAG: TIGR02391 family protein, partial [Dysgonamonadaceae bacterium]|nr:TIGR02391 family protein [Dysgonamonadaceae bacterium]